MVLDAMAVRFYSMDEICDLAEDGNATEADNCLMEVKTKTIRFMANSVSPERPRLLMQSKLSSQVSQGVGDIPPSAEAGHLQRTVFVGDTNGTCSHLEG